MATDPQEPIEMLGLEEAKRSFLVQLMRLEEFKLEVGGTARVVELSDDEVDELWQEAKTRFLNLEKTVEHIEQIEDKPENGVDLPDTPDELY